MSKSSRHNSENPGQSNVVKAADEVSTAAGAAERGGNFDGSQGTQFCNTVPSNDNIDKFKPLRFGIDSLQWTPPSRQ